MTGGPTPSPRSSASAKAYLAFAREEPAFYSAMFESGLAGRCKSHADGGKRARVCHHPRRGPNVSPRLAPPGMPRPPAMMMALHIWSMSHGVGVAVLRAGDAARRKLPMSAERIAGSRGADLSAWTRLHDRPQVRAAAIAR